MTRPVESKWCSPYMIVSLAKTVLVHSPFRECLYHVYSFVFWFRPWKSILTAVYHATVFFWAARLQLCSNLSLSRPHHLLCTNKPMLSNRERNWFHSTVGDWNSNHRLSFKLSYFIYKGSLLFWESFSFYWSPHLTQYMYFQSRNCDWN